jgi:hypothetical protein
MNRRSLTIRRIAIGATFVAAIAGFIAMRAAHITPVGPFLTGLWSPDAILNGTAATPFQYRILVPALVRAVLWSGLPISADDAFRAIDLLAVVAVLALGCLMLRRFRLSLLFLPILYTELMSNYAGPFANFTTCYDIPAIGLFMVGILALHDRRLTCFYVALTLGMLNRETAALLTVLFAMTEFDELPQSRFAAHLTAQFLVIVAIKSLLAYFYRDNPGFGLYSTFVSANTWSLDDSDISRLAANCVWLMSWPWLPIFGFMWFPLGVLAPLIRERFIRRLLLVIPVEILGMMFVGNIWEARIFNELVPVIFIGTAGALAEALRRLASRSPKLRDTLRSQGSVNRVVASGGPGASAP